MAKLNACVQSVVGTWELKIIANQVSLICRCLRSTQPFCLGVYGQDKRRCGPIALKIERTRIFTNLVPPSD